MGIISSHMQLGSRIQLGSLNPQESQLSSHTQLEERSVSPPFWSRIKHVNIAIKFSTFMIPGGWSLLTFNDPMTLLRAPPFRLTIYMSILTAVGLIAMIWKTYSGSLEDQFERLSYNNGIMPPAGQNLVDFVQIFMVLRQCLGRALVIPWCFF